MSFIPWAMVKKEQELCELGEGGWLDPVTCPPGMTPQTQPGKLCPVTWDNCSYTSILHVPLYLLSVPQVLKACGLYLLSVPQVLKACSLYLLSVQQVLKACGLYLLSVQQASYYLYHNYKYLNVYNGPVSHVDPLPSSSDIAIIGSGTVSTKL